jgi:hypothetical protein
MRSYRMVFRVREGDAVEIWSGEMVTEDDSLGPWPDTVTRIAARHRRPLPLDSGRSKTLGKIAFRLNPYPPGLYHWVLGFAQYAARRYEDAVATLRHDAARGTGSQRLVAASLAQLGRLEEAGEEARQYLVSLPHFSAQHWSSTQNFRNETDRQHFIEGYVKAGLPM